MIILGTIRYKCVSDFVNYGMTIENVFASTNSLERLRSFIDSFEGSSFPFFKLFSVSYYHKPGNKQMVLRDVIYQDSLIRIILC